MKSSSTAFGVNLFLSHLLAPFHTSKHVSEHLLCGLERPESPSPLWLHGPFSQLLLTSSLLGSFLGRSVVVVCMFCFPK